MRPSRNAATATSLAALKAHGAVPPRSPAARASGSSGNASSSTALERELEALEVELRDGVSRRAPGTSARTRSGRACRAGRDARGALRRGSRTSEWTTDVGCTTTSIRSYGTPKSQCASISSRPLFASVAESIVIFGPMRQVGCASASSGVTPSSSARERPRNGPPEAVRTRPGDGRRLAALEALVQRRVLAVDGEQQPPAPRPRGDRELAGSDEALLVRERERDAVLERPERRAGRPRTRRRVEDDVRRDFARGAATGSPPTWTCSTPCSAASASRGVEPDWSAHSSRSGCAATTSIACRPIEPVAPSRATRLTGAKDA